MLANCGVSFALNKQDQFILNLQDKAIGYNQQPDITHYLTIVTEIDSLNRFVTGQRHDFIKDMIISMRFLAEEKYDSALISCYDYAINEEDLSTAQQIMLQRHIGHIYFSLNGFETSKKKIMSALKFADKEGFTTTNLKMNLAFINWEKRDFDSTIFYLRQCLSGTFDSVEVYSQIAMFYTQPTPFQNPDSTFYYARSALDICSSNNDYSSDRLADIYSSLGRSERARNNIDSAIFYLKLAVAEPQKLYNWYPKVQATFSLAELYREIGKADSSRYYIKQLKVSPNLATERKGLINEFKSWLYEDLGDMEKSQEYYIASAENRSEMIFELREDIERLTKMSVSNLELVEENLHMKNEKITVINSRNTAYIWLIISLSMLILIVLLLAGVISKKKKKEFQLNQQLAKAEIRELRLSEENLKLEIKGKQLDLSNLATKSALEIEFVTEVKNNLSRISKLDSSLIKKKLEHFILDLYSFDGINKNIQILQEDIEKVNSKLIFTLKNEFPNLSNNDIQICLLHLLKLSTKEIAILKNVTPKAVQMSRYRIKKKMGLAPEDDIISFLERRI